MKKSGLSKRQHALMRKPSEIGAETPEVRQLIRLGLIYRPGNSDVYVVTEAGRVVREMQPNDGE